MRALPLLFVVVVAAAVMAQDATPQSPKPQPATKAVKVELRWAEFNPIPGLTEDKGIPFGEDGTSLTYLHRKAVLTDEDILEARIGAEFTVGTGDAAKKLHAVSLYFSEEGKQKLARAGEPGKKKLLATLLDGRNPSTFYVDVADLSKFVQPVGLYEKKDAEAIVAGIKLAIAAARRDGQADNPNDVQTKSPISAKNVDHLRPVKEVPKRADLIIRGPQRGELTVLDWGTPVEVVDEANLQTLRTMLKDHWPTDFASSPDWKFVAWTEARAATYFVQEIAGGKTLEIGIGNHGYGAAFSPDSKLLAIGHSLVIASDLDEGSCEMTIWDTSGRLVRTLEGSKQGAQKPLFSPDGKTLAVGNRNYETRLFEVATGKLLHTLNKRMTHEIAFSPDGKTLAAAYVDGNVGLWDVESGKSLYLIPSGCTQVFSVAWSPKGDVLASAGTHGIGSLSDGRKGMIHLWEPRTMKKLRELEVQKYAYQVRFTADGSGLISSSAAGDTSGSERKIILWEAHGEFPP